MKIVSAKERFVQADIGWIFSIDGKTILLV